MLLLRTFLRSWSVCGVCVWCVVCVLCVVCVVLCVWCVCVGVNEMVDSFIDSFFAPKTQSHESDESRWRHNKEDNTRLRVKIQNASVCASKTPVSHRTRAFWRHTRRSFESTHGGVLNLHTHAHNSTHTNTADNQTQMSPNHLHESPLLAHKPPTWATSPIL